MVNTMPGLQPTIRRRHATNVIEYKEDIQSSVSRNASMSNMKQNRAQQVRQRRHPRIQHTGDEEGCCDEDELSLHFTSDVSTDPLSPSQSSSISISSDETLSYNDVDSSDDDEASSSMLLPLWQPPFMMTANDSTSIESPADDSESTVFEPTLSTPLPPSWVTYQPSNLIVETDDYSGYVDAATTTEEGVTTGDIQTSHSGGGVPSGIVSDTCPTCGTPLSFTPLGDALICTQPGCSPHRYRIAESTVENLPFGEDVAYFKTMPNKMTNHAQKIVLTILGNGSKSRGSSSSSNGSGSTTTNGKTTPAYLSDGVLSYMRLCIRAARAHYALFWFGRDHSGDVQQDPLSSSQNSAEASAAHIWQEHVTADMLNGMTALMASSTQTAKRYLKSTLVHYLHISQPSEFGIESPVGLSKVCKRVAEHYQMLRHYGIAFQPMILSPEAPVTIHEVYAFGKSHGYRTIYEDHLTEVYCKLSGQSMPTLTPAMQRDMRLLYSQFHSFYKARFADKDTCDALFARDLAAVDAEYIGGSGGDFVVPTHTAISEALLKRVVTPAWDYKYVWEKIFGLFGATHLRQFVCVNVKLAKFIKLEQTFRVICKHLGYHFTPTPFAWQPDVTPIDVSTLTALQQQYETEAAMAASTTAQNDNDVVACMTDAQYDRQAAHATRHYAVRAGAADVVLDPSPSSHLQPTPVYV